MNYTEKTNSSESKENKAQIICQNDKNLISKTNINEVKNGYLFDLE